MIHTLIDLLTNKEKELVREKHFSKGEIIFHEDELCSSIGVILEGRVDIVSYSFGGNEIIYNSLTSGQIFGNNLVYSTSPEYKGDVISVEPTTVAFISQNDLTYLLQNNKLFLEEYLKIQSDFGKSLNSRIKLLSIDNAFERFEYYMYINDNHITYKSITSLAATLHLKRETLSRLISSLEKRHLVRRLNKEIYYLG